MEYVTFTNTVGVEHKMWSRREGDAFVCMKLENEGKEPERVWTHKKFTSKEDADHAILSYVEKGLKAKIFVKKRIE